MNNIKNLSVEEIFNSALKNHQENKFEEAKDLYDQILKINPNYAQAHNNLGVIFQNSKEYQKAIKCYEKAIEIIPNYSNAHNNLGIIFKENGDTQKAINYYEKAIEIDSNYLNPYLNLGKLFQEAEEYQKAKNYYEKAIEIQPNNLVSNFNLGIIFFELNENQKAKYYYEKAIEIKPNYAEAYNNLGNIYVELGKNYEAITYYQKAIALKATFADAYANMGRVQKTLGKLEEAINSFKSAKQIDPNLNCEVSFAATYLKDKDPEKALFLLENFLKKFPHDSRANAYKTISLRGLAKFDQIEKLIDFPNLIKKVDAQILTKDKMLEFNKELRNVLIKDPRRKVEKDNDGWAIRGGTVIRDLFNTTNPSIAKFNIYLRKAIDYYIDSLPDNNTHPFLKIKTKKYNITSSWVNFLEPGDFQANHIHNNGWMSGVYYLDEPKVELNKEHAGWIEFNRAGYNLPHFAGEKGIELIKPKANMFIFFPSYIWHGTIPYREKYSRISISFDIRIT